MTTTPTLENYYVGWSDDNRTYQLLGLYEASSMKDAVTDASKNHGKPGRYMIIPDDKVAFIDITFDMVPQLSKVAQSDTIPLPDTPVVIP